MRAENLSPLKRLHNCLHSIQLMYEYVLVDDNDGRRSTNRDYCAGMTVSGTPSAVEAVDIGSTHDIFARRILPKCTLVALKTPDEATLAVQTGRADCVIQVIMLSMVTVKKNPKVGTVLVPTPLAAQPTCAGMRFDADHRFVSFVDSWLAYSRGLEAVHGWIVDNLALVGIQPEDVPPLVQF